MEQVQAVMVRVSDFLWGIPLMIALIGTGLFLTLRLGFVQFRYMPRALRMIFLPPHDKTSPGEISHFQALMTALAATVGTGNIAGVATAIALGGPGATPPPPPPLGTQGRGSITASPARPGAAID